jgi:ABC-type glycerol-3-phosphate transport system substrate-binding protein
MTPAPYNGDVLTIKAGMGLFAVSAESSHIKEAKKFLDWFSKPDNMNEFNIGWNHTPVFKDQNMEMSDWQQNLYDNYIVPKKTALEINERLNGIDMTGFWADQQKLYTGQMSAREVLDRWDQSFESQLSLHEQH